jgi:RNA polymerase primary sigma factor
MRLIKIAPRITERQSISLEKYLTEVGKINLLSVDQEAELIKQYRFGDKNALNTVARANLRFVISVAKKYQQQGLSLEDLINEGNLGLIKAIQRFDETKGFKFISYAVWWIRQSIMQALAENARMVRIPSNKLNYQSKVHSAVLKFLQENEREPDMNEISDLLHLNSQEMEIIRTNPLRHLSISEPLSSGEFSDDNICMEDLLHADRDFIPENIFNEKEKHKELYAVIDRLSEREQIILKAYFGIGGNSPMKLEDIGERCGLTRERVRQIKENALQRLRSESNKKRLRGSLVCPD